MKNKILLGAMLLGLCFTVQNVNAQLEVQTSGDVIISGHAAVNGANLSNEVGLNVKASSFSNGGTTYGVYSSVHEPSPNIVPTGRGFGVLGRIFPYSSSLDQSEDPLRRNFPFYAGVAGVAYRGVGVYGSNYFSIPTEWSEGNYAGYFSGNVKVTGTLTLPTISTISDRRLQENVGILNHRTTIGLLSLLNPITYTLSQDGNLKEDSNEGVVHYGFTAQEVKEVAPELVIEDGAGYLGVNYMELIPLLVQAVQELSAEVTELKKQVKDNK